MTTFIRIKACLRRLPTRIPDTITILYIEVNTIGVHLTVVIAISGNTKKFCILIECISAGSVRDQAEEALGSQIVDPGKRCLRCGDHIFFVIIVKVTEFHKSPPIVDVLIEDLRS